MSMRGYGIPINSDRIREEATAKGWTISQLADRMGWYRNQLSGILKRERCRAYTLELIALALELPVSELMADEEAKLKVMLDPGAKIPTRAHDTDAGLDLYAMEDGVIPACGSASFDTGVHCAIPKGYVGLLTSKSGLMAKEGITSRGTIDCGYTGSIKAVLFNHSRKDYIVEKGQKITQLVIMPIITPEPEVCCSLTQTERGNGGFGSTGKF